MENNRKFSDQTYWNARFEEEGSYEWFGLTFGDLLPFLDKHLPGEMGDKNTVLMLGTGNSNLPVDMADSGEYFVIGTDYSEVAMQNMSRQVTRDESKTDNHLDWAVFDMRSMPVRPGCFDLIFEKGTIDVFFVGESDPWNISSSTMKTTEKIVTQVYEMLSEGGIFVSITFAQPHFRLPIFYQTPDAKWSVRWFPIRGKCSEFDYYVYIASKNGSSSCEMDESIVNFLHRPSLHNGAEKMRLEVDDDTEASYLTQDLGDCLF